jgi:hypothetical protein
LFYFLSKKGFSPATTLILLFSVTLQNESLAQTSGTWWKNSSLMVQGHKVVVPSYLPRQSTVKEQKLYWMGSAVSNTHPAIYSFSFSWLKSCSRRDCVFASYSVYPLPLGLEDGIYEALIPTFEEVELPSHVDGYHIPAKCFAFCNPGKFIFIYKKHLFVLTSSLANISEFKKSATTIINHY